VEEIVRTVEKETLVKSCLVECTVCVRPKLVCCGCYGVYSSFRRCGKGDFRVGLLYTILPDRSTDYRQRRDNCKILLDSDAYLKIHSAVVDFVVCKEVISPRAYQDGDATQVAVTWKSQHQMRLSF